MAVKIEFLSKDRDYEVPCLYNITGQEKVVCVIVHGFGSHKKSFTAKMMLEELPLLGIGAISFDLPAHGESEADGEFLRLNNCLADLAAVEAHARALAPKAEIVYFASSFGAYITLIHLAAKKKNCRAFLRSAAVNMPSLLIQLLTPEQKRCLKTAGECIFEKAKYGYTRDLKLTQGLFDDLERHDVFTLWQKGLAKLCMIHGEADQTVPLSNAKSFAEMFHVPLTVALNGDHQLSIPGAPEQVLKLAADFFQKI
ncbi:MAG: alpha/beta hydrolase [Spirochaetaceae bacterium]|nr:alpha/beta hydrolase [Spirochaetaceae bacterium]